MKQARIKMDVSPVRKTDGGLGYRTDGESFNMTISIGNVSFSSMSFFGDEERREKMIAYIKDNWPDTPVIEEG